MADKHADWWATWWKRDYSWEGLGALNEDGTPKRPWEGWIVQADGTLWKDPEPRRYVPWVTDKAELPDGARLATLQDYWRDQENELIPDPTSPKDEKGEHSRHFTRFHLPLHWQDGAPTGKADWGGAECKALNDLLGKKIEGSAETAFVGLGELNGPDRRVQFQGGVFLDFNAADFMSSPAKPDAEPATSPLNWRSDFAFFSGNAGFNSATFSGDAVFNRATFSGDAWFISANFPGDARFESATFSGDAGFHRANFSGSAGFESATFSGDARFNRATFSGDAGFKRSTFSGEAVFNIAAFSGDARFDRATFSGNAWFESATFSRDAWFNAAAFSGDAEFSGATFSGYARVENATVSGDARFDSATFSGDAEFSGATFFGDAKFKSATFSGYARFENATFSGYARFDSATFSGYADFNSAIFSGDAWFKSATFSGDAEFNSATFSGDALFDSVVFAGDVSFQGDGASFSVEPFQLLPMARSDKEKAKSGDVAFADKFERVIEDGSISTRAFKRASFEDCVFLGDVNFNNRDFTEATSFRRSEFWRLVSFHGSRLHQGVSFYNAIFRYAIHRDRQCVRCGPKSGGRDWPEVRDDVKRRLYEADEKAGKTASSVEEWDLVFEEGRSKTAKEFRDLDKSKYDARENKGFWTKLGSQCLNFVRRIEHKPEPVKVDTQEDYFEELEGCYRTLKLAMEDKRDRVEEGKFFSLEIKTRRRRRRPNVLYWERLMSDLYGGTSDYGNSVVRPVAWILLFMLVFGVLYALQGSSSLLGWDWKVPNFAELGQGFSYSAGRVFGFGPWGSEPEACTMMGQLLNVQPEKDVICADGHNGWGVWTAFGIKALATVQTLMAIILVFLSGLAVRRRFQIN